MWIFPQLIAGGARSLEEFRELYDEDSDHPQLLDTIKQVALYTDCIAEDRWTSPDDAIDSP